jgi:hypothetical protein
MEEMTRTKAIPTSLLPSFLPKILHFILSHALGLYSPLSNPAFHCSISLRLRSNFSSNLSARKPDSRDGSIFGRSVWVSSRL